MAELFNTPKACDYFYSTDTDLDTCFMRRCATCAWAECFGDVEKETMTIHCGAGADMTLYICDEFKALKIIEFKEESNVENN